MLNNVNEVDSKSTTKAQVGKKKARCSEIEVPETGANGVILCQAGRFGSGRMYRTLIDRLTLSPFF
jgi:hypothetical protein